MAEDVFGIVGRVFAGVYHVEQVVAESGFAVVYRAHEGGLRAKVALKLLRVAPPNASQRAEFQSIFRTQSELSFRLAASLNTLVRPLHVDALITSDGRFVPYLVFEWLEGMTLAAVLEQRAAAGQPAVPLRKLVRLFTPVVRALERAHRFSLSENVGLIAHGELKPENLFIAQVAGEEVIKILNFGLAKLKMTGDSGAVRLSQESPLPLAFTPAYAAPEQWAPRDYGQTGPWTDVWGLALCMIEVLLARPVIEGDRPAMRGIALDPLRRPTPRAVGLELPDRVEAVFARALALDPRQRQRDAGVFWDELLQALQLANAEREDADGRAERGASATLRVERPEMPLRSASGWQSRVSQPSLAVQRALAMDLEFDPASAAQSAKLAAPASGSSRTAERAAARLHAQPARDASVSGAHFVPDLDLTPAPSRRNAAAPPSAPSQVVQREVGVLDLDDLIGQGASLDLDLDLPQGDPISRRSLSSQSVAKVAVAALAPNPTRERLASGSMMAARQPSGTSLSVQIPVEFEQTLSGLGPVLFGSSELISLSSTAHAQALSDAAGVAPQVVQAPRVQPPRRRYRAPALLGGTALLVAVVDPIYAIASGEVLQIFGLRISGIAAALLLVAVGLSVREWLRVNEPG